MEFNKFKRNCPMCNEELTYSSYPNLWRANRNNSKCGKCKKTRLGCKHSDETKNKMSISKRGSNHPNWKKKLPLKTRLKMSLAQTGKTHTAETKRKLSLIQIGTIRSDSNRLNNRNATIKRYKSPKEKEKTSVAVFNAIHRPDIRKKHIDALHHSKWLKVRTDKGQLELIEKWNQLGFSFEPNYQIHTDEDLFYIDGYDVKNNVVLEYDSKYHNKSHQKQKDLARQNKIIDILAPTKFWRYDSENKTIKNVLGKEG